MADLKDHICQYDRLSFGEKYRVEFDPETGKMVQQPARALLSGHNIQQRNGLYATLRAYVGISHSLIQDEGSDIPEGRDRLVFLLQTWLGGKGNPDYRIPLIFSEKKIYGSLAMSSRADQITHWLYEHETAIINKIAHDVQNINLEKMPVWVNLNSDNYDPGRKVIKMLFMFDDFVTWVLRKIERRARKRLEVYKEAIEFHQGRTR